MLDSLEFGGGERARFNASRFAAPRSWAWAEGGRGVRHVYDAYYDKNGKAFFSVNWQVNLPKDGQDDKPIWNHRVRLQVESPTLEMDSTLNDLKWDAIQAIQNLDVEKTLVDAGFGYDAKGLRTSEKSVRQNKTTTVFYVVLNEKQANLEPDEKLKTVHTAVGSKVDEIVKRFAKRLESRFQLK